MSAEDLTRRELLRKHVMSPQERKRAQVLMARKAAFALEGIFFMTEDEYAASRVGWEPYVGPNIPYDAKTWAEGMLCRKIGPDLLFPTGESSRLAKIICGECAVKGYCLENTLRLEEKSEEPAHGFAGGLSARERRGILKQRRQQ